MKTISTIAAALDAWNARELLALQNENRLLRELLAKNPIIQKSTNPPTWWRNAPAYRAKLSAAQKHRHALAA